uniref:Smx5 n=1 Tax=Cyprinus carpio carpio TaxID=630221 RepID=A0A9J8A4I2_CYPCA
MLFYSFFKSLVGKDVVVELKNDLSICGTLHSVDQYLNIKMTDISVTDPEKYPHMVTFQCLQMAETSATDLAWIWLLSGMNQNVSPKLLEVYLMQQRKWCGKKSASALTFCVYNRISDAGSVSLMSRAHLLSCCIAVVLFLECRRLISACCM